MRKMQTAIPGISIIIKIRLHIWRMLCMEPDFYYTKTVISILDITVSDYECYLFKISTAQIMRQYR